MPRPEKKYHFLYKTTNLKNGTYYLGMHSTSKLDDGYLGSGKRLRRSIRKYGKENFKIEILEFFESREDLSDAEKKLITEDILKDSKCMNLKLGGYGGNIGVNGEVYGGDKCKAINSYWKIPENKERLIVITSERGKKLHKDGKLLNFKCDWTSRKHKEESKKKIGEKNSLCQKGEKNSQYGTMWITNGIENKKIKKDDIIPNGWYIGRKY